MMHIPFSDLTALHSPIEKEIKERINEIIFSSEFIGGKYNRLFSEEFATSIGVKHCIGVGNGTDGLEIALLALGIQPSDEVIVPANSFVATAEAVCNVGANVVFADCHPDTYNIDPVDILRKITPNTKCIIPVHLYGKPAAMDEILHIAKLHNLYIVEDCAQAHGAVYKNKKVGSIGHISVFSFYPGKNLGAMGDAGAVCTDDDNLADLVKKIANHGRIDKYDHDIIGRNSRLDNLQAGILQVKLKHLDSWNKHRFYLAENYYRSLETLPNFFVPKHSESVYHLYVVRTPQRDKLRKNLSENGIETGIHYPIGLPFLRAFSYLGHKPEDFPVTHAYQAQLLSLPMPHNMTVEQFDYVCEKIRFAINDFEKK
jgi:dTDP-4-amino-4,6-dideoxygalactose transaminase